MLRLWLVHHVHEWAQVDVIVLNPSRGCAALEACSSWMVGCLVLLVESVNSLCSRGRIVVTVIVTVRILIYHRLLLATKAVIMWILGHGFLVQQDL